MMLTRAICISVLSIFRILFSTSLTSASYPTLKSDRGDNWLYYSGENVTLHCYTSKSNCSISFTYRNENKISSEFVTFINGTYARLDKPVQEDDPYDTRYNCMTNCNGSISPSNRITVLTEYRPQNVTNLWYRWLGRKSLHVGWDLGLPEGYKCSIDKCPNNPMTQVAVLYTTDPTGKWRNCTSLNTTSCIIESFTVPWFFLSVNISNIKRQDVAPSFFPERQLFDHVKPLPVELLQGKAVNSTCVELKWMSVPPAHNYTVHYSTTDSSNKMVTKEQIATVCNLHPSLEYNFEVVAVQGYESDPAKTSAAMPEDVPSRGPGVSKSSFHRRDCIQNSADITVYFEPVEKEDMNGEIMNYTLEGENGVSIGVPPGRTSFNFSTTCDQELSYTLFAYTKAGPSPPSQLQIPALSTVRDLLDILKKMDLKVEIKSSSMHRKAFWEPPSVDDNTTFYLYYCVQTKSLCKNVQINASTGFHTWEVGDVNLYGLAAVSPHDKGTGIVFTDCVYDKSSPSGTAPTGLKVRQIGETVEVRWNAQRCVSTATGRVMRTDYLLEVCYEENCKEHPVKGGDVSAYDIVDVKFEANYSVKIAANTTSGLTDYSSPEFVTPVFVTRAESGGETDKVGIAMGVLAFVLVLGGFGAWLWREMRRRERQMFSHSLKFPEPPNYRENELDTNNSPRTLVSSSPTSLEEERNLAFTDNPSIKKYEEVQKLESGYHSAPSTPTEESKVDQQEHKLIPAIPTREHSLDTKEHVPGGYVSCVEAPTVSSEQITVGFIQGGMPIKLEDSINTNHTSFNPAYVPQGLMFGDLPSIIPADEKVRFKSEPSADRSLISPAQRCPENYMLVGENSPTFSSINNEESITKETIRGQNTEPCMQSGYLPHLVVTAAHDITLLRKEELTEMMLSSLQLDAREEFFDTAGFSPVLTDMMEPISQSVATEEAGSLNLNNQGQQRKHSFCQEDYNKNSENGAEKDAGSHDGFVEVISSDLAASALTACDGLFQSADSSACKSPNNNYILLEEAHQINEPGGRASNIVTGSNVARSGELLETIETNPAVHSNMWERFSEDGEVGQEENYDNLLIPEMRMANHDYLSLQSVSQLPLKLVQETVGSKSSGTVSAAGYVQTAP